MSRTALSQGTRSRRENMRALTIEESFGQFVEEPTPDTWNCLRERIICSAAYDPYSASWHRLDLLIGSGCFEEASRLAKSLEAWACLSPRWHYWMGVSALECGDPLLAAGHRAWLGICLDAILQSGDGTPESPFRVLYSTDAYDVLQVLGEVAEGQQLLEDERGCRDVLTAKSGQTYWFDVAEMLARCVAPGREQGSEESLDRSAAAVGPTGDGGRFTGRASS